MRYLVMLLLLVLPACGSAGAARPARDEIAQARAVADDPPLPGRLEPEHGAAAEEPSTPPAATPPDAPLTPLTQLTPPELPPPSLSARRTSSARRMRVHFPSREDPYADCAAHGWVERSLRPGADPVDFALRTLLEGPSPSEREQGWGTPFDHSVADPSIPPLRGDQVRVRLHGRVAVVDFTKEAAPYLYQAICARAAVTSSIENTLLQLTVVDEVQFAVAGVVIDEWDA